MITTRKGMSSATFEDRERLLVIRAKILLQKMLPIRAVTQVVLLFIGRPVAQVIFLSRT